VQALKFYKKHLDKKFTDLSVKTLTSRIIELSTESPFPIEVDPLIAATPRKWTNNDNYAVFIESNDRYELYG